MFKPGTYVYRKPKLISEYRLSAKAHWYKDIFEKERNPKFLVLARK